MKNSLSISEYDLIKADACGEGKYWFNKTFKPSGVFYKIDFKEVVEKCPHKYLGWAIIELPWRYAKFIIDTKSVPQLKRLIKLPCLFYEYSIEDVIYRRTGYILMAKELRVKKELKLRGVIK